MKNMALLLLFWVGFLCLGLGSGATSTGFLAQKITTKQASVEIGTRTTIGAVSDGFLCATLDYWPGDKCDYGTCSWRHASVLNLDLEHPSLYQAVRALSPLTLRVGGSLQDRLVYKVGSSTKERPCTDFVKQSGAIFGYTEGCLNMSRWQALNHFFQRTSSSVIFGLNALHGRQRVSKGVYTGAWDPSNARDFMQYTADNKFQVQAWELGNELSANGVGATINSRQYALDSKALRNMVEKIYADSPSKPLVVAPDGFFVASWYQQLLVNTGPQVLDAITRHIYNLGPAPIVFYVVPELKAVSAGRDPHLIQKILNPAYLSQEVGAFKQMRDTLSRYGPWAQAWIGEAGGAYNSGQHLVNDAFISSFWYLDQLGMASSHNTAVYCRQSLVGGNYGLLRTETFQPNPDFYSALLWKQLMGRDVLPATVMNETYLRAYAHCSKSNQGGVTALLINLSNSTVYTVSLDLTVTSGYSWQPNRVWASRKQSSQRGPRFEYHLSAPETNLRSQSVLLNGHLLEPNKDGQIPRLQPVEAADPSQPIRVSPLTIVFVELPEAEAPACIIAS